MVDIHLLFRFSLACRSEDLAVVYCLRAIAEYSQKNINPRIAWGGTKDADWRRDGHAVTFHFSSAENRDGFLQTAQRLLAHGLWTELARSDDDPAKPQ